MDTNHEEEETSFQISVEDQDKLKKSVIDKAECVDLNKSDNMRSFITETLDQHLQIVNTTLSTEFGKLVKIMETRLDPIKDLVADMGKLKVELNTNLEKNRLLCKYDSDAIEQYSRRDNIRITGITEVEGEDLFAKITEITKDIGVVVDPRLDISTVHRVGRRNATGTHSRPIICKFVRRRTKDEVMRSRKKLKDIGKYKGLVYINEDLTTLRSKLLGYVKSLPDVLRVNSNSGKLFCNLKNGSLVVIENPDDLFNLGLNDIDYNRLGLANYTSANNAHK